jgi:putative ABC transport system permease protein
MTRPRWAKVFRDIWNNKTRSLLIVLSIAVGVFAVGVVAHMNLIVSRDLERSYALVSPAHITAVTDDTFPEELLASLRRLPGVAEVAGERRLTARFRHPDGAKWFPIELVAVPNYKAMAINKIFPEQRFNPDPQSWTDSVWPPPRRGLVLERTSLLAGQLGLVQSKRGDSLVIEMPDGRDRTIELAGLAYEFNQVPATFAGRAYGYITFDTLEWLGQSRDYNTIYLRVSDPGAGPAALTEVANRVRAQVERGGYSVATVETHTQGKLPLDYVFRAISIILGALGVISLVLSSFLLINTVTAMLRQQVRQIGVMKTIGARSGDLVGMYLSMVACFGLLALLLALPLALEGARAFSEFLSYFLNFQIAEFRTPPEVVLSEAAMALLVPLLAALYPVISGTRISIQDALNSYGIGAEQGGRLRGWLLSLDWVPRQLMLSLTNTLRHRGRLTLTLTTLTLASTAFAMMLNVRASMDATIDETFALWHYDVQIQFRRPVDIERARQEALLVPGIARVELWGESSTYRTYADEHTSAPMVLVAPPADTQLLRPTIIAGRWLRPDDTDALVIDSRVRETEPDLDVGSALTLTLNGRKREWRVVGVARTIGVARFVYANYPTFAQLARQEGKAVRLQATTASRSRADQAEVTRALSEQLKQANLDVAAALTITELRDQSELLFTILTTMLLAMASLLALIGGLGLAGTMGLNVLERTREIGVMRAIGAATRDILLIVMSEGLLLGLWSWLAGVLLAIPLGRALSDQIGLQIFQTPMIYTISLPGALLWLGLMIALASLSSYAPAQHAAQLSVQTSLDYQ